MKSTVFAFSFLLAAWASAQPAPNGQELPKFMGRAVTFTAAELADGVYPKNPASLCVKAPFSFERGPFLLSRRPIHDRPKVRFGSE
jgi:hypothetical protein